MYYNYTRSIRMLQSDWSTKAWKSTSGVFYSNDLGDVVRRVPNTKTVTADVVETVCLAIEETVRTLCYNLVCKRAKYTVELIF